MLCGYIYGFGSSTDKSVGRQDRICYDFTVGEKLKIEYALLQPTFRSVCYIVSLSLSLSENGLRRGQNDFFMNIIGMYYVHLRMFLEKLKKTS